MNRILPGVRSISGHAMDLLLEVVDTLARWKDALPNDPETIRETARRAQDALDRAADAPTPTAAKSALSRLPMEQLREMHRARLAWFKAGTRAVDNAYRQFGPNWGKAPGHRVVVFVPRRLRVFISKTGKVSLEAQEQIVPAPCFWDEAMPEGVAILRDAPCFYRPDIRLLMAEGGAWAGKTWQQRHAAQLAEAEARREQAFKDAATDAYGNRAA